MNGLQTSELRNALHTAPLPAGLEPNPLEVLHQGQRARRRRRLRAGVTGPSVAAAVAVAGFWVADVTGWPGPAEDVQLAAEPDVTVVPADREVFDIGRGWQMLVDDDDDALCMGPGPGPVPDSGLSCGVDVQFNEDSTFAFVGDDPSAPVYGWVVRDTTTSAALVSDTEQTLSAQVYEISALGFRVAVVHDYPTPQAGWSLVSRDADGTVTDSVPWSDQEVGTLPAPDNPGG